MTYSKAEVFSIVREMLGDGAEDIYLPSEEFEIGCSDAFPISLGTYGAFNVEGTMEVEVYRGATKVVLVPVQSDYAIKLNISGTYLTEDECDEAGFQYPHIDRLSSENVLDEENIMFESLPKELKEIILPNIYIGDCGNIPVYIQKKVKATYGRVTGLAEARYKAKGKSRTTSVQKALKSSTPVGLNWIIHSVLPEAFVSDLIDFYGEEKASLILQQLSVSEITDLNYENFGYDMEDRPCIFDIAGYNENDFFEYDEHFYESKGDCNFIDDEEN